MTVRNTLERLGPSTSSHRVWEFHPIKFLGLTCMCFPLLAKFGEFIDKFFVLTPQGTAAKVMKRI